MLVSWPLVMLLLDYWPMGRFKSKGVWRLVVEKVPFFALAAVTSLVTIVVQHRVGAIKTAEVLALDARIGNALVSYCRYLGKLFWPVDLAVFYPHPGYWPVVQVLLAGGLVLGISVLVFVKRRRYPFMLMGWLWFCGTLVPVIGLVQVGEQAMADRYAYIPSLGVMILAVWGAYELAGRWRHGVIGLWAGGVVAIILCLGLTRGQIGYWKDSETLFEHALAVTENNYLAHNNVGTTLGEKGQIDDAIRELREAIRLKPNYADAHNNLGTALGVKGQPDEAIREFQEAIRLNPDYAEAHNNLGTALSVKGRTDDAIRQYQEALRLKPDYADARNNLARVLGTNNAPAGR
jgi:tetratricopeptide (TPR) repeat protein